MKRTPMRRQSSSSRARASELAVLKAAICVRASYRCENPWCRMAAALDAHHVVKRSQGGEDTRENLVALCRRCHDRTDRPRGEGRLEIESLGEERFAWSIDGKRMELNHQDRGA